MEVMRITNRTETKILEKCAGLYCKIFAEPPWNEENWTIETVLNDMREQAQLSGFCGFLIKTAQDEIVGFTWGYLVSKDEMRHVAGNQKLDFLFDGYEEIFYVDELGVGSAYRDRGLGRKLSQSLLVGAKAVGAESMMLRTDRKAEAARELYLSLGFQDLQIEDEAYADRTYWHRAL